MQQENPITEWQNATQTIQQAIDTISNTDDLDVVVATTKEAIPQFNVINNRLADAIALGAEMFGVEHSVKAIQTAIKPLLNVPNVSESLPPEIHEALIKIRDYTAA